jgi:predicted nucleotidyltransferase
MVARATSATHLRDGIHRRIPVRVIHAVAAAIADQFQPERIILFGSYAYGKPQPWSDVDMLVVMDTPLRNREQAAQIARALDYHFGLDLLVRTPKQLAKRLALGDFFLQEVVSKGKVLYARPDSRMRCKL